MRNIEDYTKTRHFWEVSETLNKAKIDYLAWKTIKTKMLYACSFNHSVCRNLPDLKNATNHFSCEGTAFLHGYLSFFRPFFRVRASPTFTLTLHLHICLLPATWSLWGSWNSWFRHQLSAALCQMKPMLTPTYPQKEGNYNASVCLCVDTHTHTNI